MLKVFSVNKSAIFPIMSAVSLMILIGGNVILVPTFAAEGAAMAYAFSIIKKRGYCCYATTAVDVCLELKIFIFHFIVMAHRLWLFPWRNGSWKDSINSYGVSATDSVFQYWLCSDMVHLLFAVQACLSQQNQAEVQYVWNKVCTISKAGCYGADGNWNGKHLFCMDGFAGVERLLFLTYSAMALDSSLFI